MAATQTAHYYNTHFAINGSVTASGNVTSLISANLGLNASTVAFDVDPAGSTLVVSGSLVNYQNPADGLNKTGAAR